MRSTLGGAALGGTTPGRTATDGRRTPGAQTSGDTVTVRDDLGREVAVVRPVTRIVSLVPALTEILFALEEGPRLVGRTRYGVHPRAARAVPVVGEGIRPSLEAVAARRPDLVLLFAAADARSTAARLAALEVPVLALRHDDLDDLERNLERLGRILGREEEADRLRRRILCRLEAVAEVTRDLPRPRVYYEVWGDPPVSVGGGSYLDSLLRVAGATNVFGDLAPASPRVGLEALVVRQPELILRARRTGGEAAPPPEERPGWELLEAVREGRVRAVDGELVHRLGPRLGEAAAALAAIVHPEARPLLERALGRRCGGGEPVVPAPPAF